MIHERIISYHIRWKYSLQLRLNTSLSSSCSFNENPNLQCIFGLRERPNSDV